MIIKEHIFNPCYSGSWQEKPFLPTPSLRNVKMALNFLVNRIEHKLLMTRLFSYPYFLMIDSSNVCNLHCPLCPTGQGDTSRPRCFLKFEDFKKIIDKLGDYAISILFTIWGEPLLNRDLSKIIRYTKKVKRVPFVSVFTNLNVSLSDKDLKELIKSDLNLILIAVDGATQKTYEKYRRGGSLKKVIDNTKKILEKRKELGKNSPFVVWQFLVFKHNQHEIESTIELAKKTGVDAIRISAAHVYIDCVDKPFENSYEISKKYLPPLGSKYSIYAKDGKKKNIVKRCQWLWQNIAINSDGGVTPCCGVLPKKYDFGDILNEKNFRAIWNNEKYQTARKVVKDRNHAKKLFREGNSLVCTLCTVYGNWF